MQAPLYKTHYAALGLNAKLAFTCHNFEPQGRDSMESLDACGIEFKGPVQLDDFQDNICADQINVLKVRKSSEFVAKVVTCQTKEHVKKYLSLGLRAQGGLVHSDFITTVSPTYAKEVLTPEVRNTWFT